MINKNKNLDTVAFHNNSGTVQIEKPKIGLNFKIITNNLTKEFKLKVILGQINLRDVFDITESSSDMLLVIIKKSFKNEELETIIKEHYTPNVKPLTQFQKLIQKIIRK